MLADWESGEEPIESLDEGSGEVRALRPMAVTRNGAYASWLGRSVAPRACWSRWQLAHEKIYLMRLDKECN